MEALLGLGGSRVYRFWRGHRKVEYIKIKTPVGSKDF